MADAPPDLPPAATTWLQSTLLWASISLAATIVLTVVGVMLKDVRWVLFLAWPFASIAIWEFARLRRMSPVAAVSVAGSVLALAALGAIYLVLPSGNVALKAPQKAPRQASASPAPVPLAMVHRRSVPGRHRAPSGQSEPKNDVSQCPPGTISQAVVAPQSSTVENIGGSVDVQINHGESAVKNVCTKIHDQTNDSAVRSNSDSIDNVPVTLHCTNLRPGWEAQSGLEDLMHQVKRPVAVEGAVRIAGDTATVDAMDEPTFKGDELVDCKFSPTNDPRLKQVRHVIVNEPVCDSFLFQEFNLNSGSAPMGHVGPGSKRACEYLRGNVGPMIRNEGASVSSQRVR